jgi:hypothetical protein
MPLQPEQAENQAGSSSNDGISILLNCARACRQKRHGKQGTHQQSQQGHAINLHGTLEQGLLIDTDDNHIADFGAYAVGCPELTLVVEQLAP